MNKWIGIGNLFADPEKIEANELVLCKFRMAVPENYTKDGERPVQAINVTVWNKLAENVLKYVKKGDKVAVIGRIGNRTYESNGQKKYVTEVVAEEIEFLTTHKKEEKQQFEPVDTEILPF